MCEIDIWYFTSCNSSPWSKPNRISIVSILPLHPAISILQFHIEYFSQSLCLLFTKCHLIWMDFLNLPHLNFVIFAGCLWRWKVQQVTCHWVWIAGEGLLSPPRSPSTGPMSRFVSLVDFFTCFFKSLSTCHDIGIFLYFRPMPCSVIPRKTCVSVILSQYWFANGQRVPLFVFAQKLPKTIREGWGRAQEVFGK